MKHIRLIILIVLAIAVTLATIHFTINGFPSLDRLNPHAEPGGSVVQLPVDLASKVLVQLEHSAAVGDYSGRLVLHV